MIVPYQHFKKDESLKNLCTIAAFLMLIFELCCCVCDRAEYELDNGECCPMCAPGNRVYRHCTVYTSTTCVPCDEATFTAEPNGLLKCISCTVCDSEQGLRVKVPCSRASDTVCESVDGYYCTDLYKGSCRQAEEHTQCHPGEYIEQKGTTTKNTVCTGCKAGTYSNGSLPSCLQHSKCEDLGLKEVKPGTISSDAVCKAKSSVLVISLVISAVSVTIIIAAVVGVVIKHHHQKPHNQTAETIPELANLNQ